MAARLLLLVLVALMLACTAKGAQLTEPTNVSVSIDSPAHVDNLTFEIVDYSYGDTTSNAWVILRTQYHNTTIEDEPIQLPQSIISFVYGSEPYEYNFSVGSLEYTTGSTEINLTDIVVWFRGNPPKPEITFNVSVLTTEQPTFVSSIHVEKLVRDTGYVNERFPIEIDIQSNLSIPLVLNVSDTVPEQFVVDPYTDLSWQVNLQPHGVANLSYTVQALVPGRYVLPRPKIEAEQAITISWGSNNITTTVLGPYVNATKQASLDGDVVSVKLILNNTGIENVDVWVVDTLPEGGRLVSGTPNITAHLRVGESINTSYTFSAPRGRVVLPPAQVLFVSHHRVDKYFREDVLLPPYFQPHVDPRYAYGVSYSNAVVLERPAPSRPLTTNTSSQSTPVSTTTPLPRETKKGLFGMPAYDGVLLLAALALLAYLRRYL